MIFIRDWLKEIRTNENLTQDAVAKKIGITQQFYNYIENGERRPSPETAKKIGAVLNFDWTIFYEEEKAAELLSKLIAKTG